MLIIAFLKCFVQNALQEALRANVALEDINRTALVRLKQVSIISLDVTMKMHASCYFHKHFASRALRSLVSGFPTRSRPRMPRKTLRAAASVQLTGLRCEPHPVPPAEPFKNILAKFSKYFGKIFQKFCSPAIITNIQKSYIQEGAKQPVNHSNNNVVKSKSCDPNTLFYS